VTDREVIMHIDWGGTPHLVGRLWSRMRRSRESASFDYDPEWLRHGERFALEPALSLDPGPFHTEIDRPLFGAFGDSAPDRWGRVLMRRAERRRAAQRGTTPRTLLEIDFLLGVDDEARQGALRFALAPGGPFLAQSDDARIPPWVELPRLLGAASRFIDEDENDEDMRLLLAPGSSLGGARPKASVRDRDGSLAIAKFPHKGDEWNTVVWEAVALALAAKAGVDVPDWRLENVEEKPVLISKRFDRAGATRIPFLSATSMLGARDNEIRSYLEIVDALRQQGARAKRDMRQLWRRVVFNVLVSNVDDHLRNHAFLYTGSAGWALSPAYDLNPVPIDVKPRVLSCTIDLDDPTASLGLALSVAPYFDVSKDDASDIANEVAAAVSGWRGEAVSMGLSAAECDRMASAFEHDDSKAALALKRA
jgi:serine/threonine-protein kinase HipA